MNRRALLTLPVLALSLIASAQDTHLKQTVDQYMLPLMKKKHAAGAIVGLSIHGKRSYFAYGTATDAGAPFTSTTLVEIGSCTKVFTTTLFTLATARHQIDPNASIQTYMPAGLTLKPLAQKVTPLQLADFSSGIPQEPNTLPSGIEGRRIENYPTEDFLKWVANWEPAQAPPAPYHYTNASIGLLGDLLETAVGRSWNTQVNTDILDPLGMTDTELRPTANQQPRLAEGHIAKGVKAPVKAPVWPVPAWYAAGSLQSTAEDMLRFGEANLGHKLIDGRTVPDELIAAMKSAQAPIYPLGNGTSKQDMAWVSNFGPPNSSLVIVKDGLWSGFSTVIALVPDKDTTIFIAVNQQQGDAEPAAMQIARHIGAAQ